MSAEQMPPCLSGQTCAYPSACQKTRNCLGAVLARHRAEILARVAESEKVPTQTQGPDVIAVRRSDLRELLVNVAAGLEELQGDAAFDDAIARLEEDQHVVDERADAVREERRRIARFIDGYSFSADSYTYDVVMGVLGEIKRHVGK